MIERNDETVVDIISEGLLKTGMSARHASIEATGNPSTIRHILTGRSVSPRSSTLSRIADVLGLDRDRLLRAAMLSPPPLPPRSEIREAGVPVPRREDMPRDVPVLGTVAGSPLGQGAFQLTTDVIDYVGRPLGLMGARDAYALYVEGESMVPRYEPGDLVFVHPHRKARVGDYVIIQEPDTDNGAPRGFIKRLVSMSEGRIKAEQFNPPMEIVFTRPGTIVHKVLGGNELYGI